MRRVLAFGAGRDFAKGYGGFLKRHGFELEIFNPGACADETGEPAILMVFGDGLGRDASHAADYLSARDRRLLPLIFISGADNHAPAHKKIKDHARYALPDEFLKKELLTALRGCSEVLALRDKCLLLKQELVNRTSELSYVLDIARTLASSFDLTRVLSKIMERACSLVNAATWSVMLVDEDSDELVFEAARGKAGRKGNRYRLKFGEGIAGWAAQDKGPKLVPDVSVEKRFCKAIDKVTGIATKSLMAAPITSKGKLLGVIELINKEGGGGFTERDLTQVSRLMDQTAIAIDRAKMYQRMEGLVVTDDLTKLFNLRYLHRTLEVEIERASRYGLAVALIFIDLDYFKQVNDQHGHLVGSKLLVEVSQQFLKSLRKVDIVARYGGDEFVVVLPQTDVKAATMIAERLRRNIERHVFMKSMNLNIKLTGSFGIACYPDHAANREDLIRLADEAMYAVKYRTRNSVYVVGS